MILPVLERSELRIPEALSISNGAAAGYRLGHIMLRISDPEESLKFYSELLGMSLIFRWNTGPMTVYYLGHAAPEDKTPLGIYNSMSSRLGLLELIHAHGDKDKSSEGVSSSHVNDSAMRSVEASGFGHLGFLVPNVENALERAKKLGYIVLKTPEDTSTVALALPCDNPEAVFDTHFLSAFTQIGFLRDPDG